MSDEGTGQAKDKAKKTRDRDWSAIRKGMGLGDKPKDKRPENPRNQEWVNELSCGDIVMGMIRNGMPVAAIARFLDEQKVMPPEMKIDAIRMKLVRFIKNMPALEVIESRLPSTYLSVVESIGNNLDEVEAMSTLWHLQFDRFMIDYKTEKTLGKLFTSHNETMRVLLEIASKLGELKNKTLGTNLRYRPHINQGPSTAEIQQELLAKTKENISAKYGEKMAELAADPAKRRKLLSLFEKVTTMGDPKLDAILNKYNVETGAMKDVNPDMQDTGFVRRERDFGSPQTQAPEPEVDMSNVIMNFDDKR